MECAENIRAALMATEKTIHDWADWALKAMLVGVVTLSVSYLKNVADHLSSLDVAVKDIQYELKTSSNVQSVVNEELKSDLSRVVSRVDHLEKTCSRGAK